MRLCGFSNHFWLLSPCTGQVLHALLTRPPLTSNILQPKSHSMWSPFDLHVLGTPPAFILSQDQTLWKNVFNRTWNIGPLNTRFWCSRQLTHFCSGCLSSFTVGFATVRLNSLLLPIIIGSYSRLCVKNCSRIVCVSLFSYQGARQLDCRFLFCSLATAYWY